MNKFLNLADKLIKNKLWTNNAIVIQLKQEKNESGKVVYKDYITKELNCVKKDLSKKIEDNKFIYLSEFYFSAKSLMDLDLDKNKLAVIYNEKRYIVEDVVQMGTLNNQDSIIKLVIRR